MIALLLRHWRVLAAAAAVLALLTVLWVAYAWAYGRGYAAARAHYEPILAEVRTAAIRADARARAVESRAARDVERLSEEYRRRETEIESRAADAERALSERLRRAAAAAGRCRVSEDSAAAAADHGAAGRDAGDERARRAAAIARRAIELGRAWELDAARLAACQAYVRSLP